MGILSVSTIDPGRECFVYQEEEFLEAETFCPLRALSLQVPVKHAMWSCVVVNYHRSDASKKKWLLW